MTEICYPPGTDWGCSYSEEQLAEMWGKADVAATMRRSEALAWMTLAALTADQVATCPIVVRPCSLGCQNGSDVYLAAPATAPFGPGYGPYIGANGTWYNSCGCSTPGECSCTVLSEVILPGPVGDIVEIWLDGAVFDSANYRVDNGNRLVRLDGGAWPACQPMQQNEHGDDAFSVTYYRGAAPDSILLYAAGLLAVEWYKACTSDKTCRLPAGVQNVSRQGVSYQIQTSLFSDGTTGIREVDAVIARYNPWGLKMAPTISTPQTIRRPRQTTWSR